MTGPTGALYKKAFWFFILIKKTCKPSIRSFPWALSKFCWFSIKRRTTDRLSYQLVFYIFPKEYQILFHKKKNYWTFIRKWNRPLTEYLQVFCMKVRWASIEKSTGLPLFFYRITSDFYIENHCRFLLPEDLRQNNQLTWNRKTFWSSFRKLIDITFKLAE